MSRFELWILTTAFRTVKQSLVLHSLHTVEAVGLMEVSAADVVGSVADFTVAVEVTVVACTV